MKISKTTAQNIVNRAMKVIGKSVNVMDERGIARGDNDAVLVHHIHRFADYLHRAVDDILRGGFADFH